MITIFKKTLFLYVFICFVNIYPMHFASVEPYNLHDFDFANNSSGNTNIVIPEISSINNIEFSSMHSSSAGNNDLTPRSKQRFIDFIRNMQIDGNIQGINDTREQLLRDRTDPTAHAKIDIIDEFLNDPLTPVFDTIKNADPDIAMKELDHLKMQLLKHFESQNFNTMDEAREDMIKREGIDLLQAADDCFKSRSDYQKILAQQPLKTLHNPKDIIDRRNKPRICGSVGVTLNAGINLLNPITTLIGQGLSLDTFKPENDPLRDDVFNSYPEETNNVLSLQERAYYENRRKELIELKQKFETIQTLLKNICSTNTSGVGFNLLNSLPQSNIKEIIQPTRDAELKLNESEKNNLRTLRELDLNNIEHSIIDIQENIAFLFKELIVQKDQAINDFYNALSDINSHIEHYNNLLDSNGKKNVDINVAKSTYEKQFQAEALLDEIKERIDELKFVIKSYQYYAKEIDTSVVGKTTNIDEIIEQEIKNIDEIEKKFAQQRIIIESNKKIHEAYLSQHVNVCELASTYKEQAKQQRHAKKENKSKQAKANRANFGSPKMPKKDDDKDESKNSSKENEQNKKSWQRMTAKQAREAAKNLGFEETNYYSDNEPVFRKKDLYITPDKYGHNGGVWKMGKSPKDLLSKTTRLGTYDANLNRIGD